MLENKIGIKDQGKRRRGSQPKLWGSSRRRGE